MIIQAISVMVMIVNGFFLISLLKVVEKNEEIINNTTDTEEVEEKELTPKDII